MLVLLAILMISAALLKADARMQRSASTVQNEPHPLTISIRADGSILIGERQVAFSRVAPQVREAAGPAADPRIFVRAQTGAPYELIARLVAALSTKGLTSVDLIADPGAPTGKTGDEPLEPRAP
jgi:biopolymer transport protein TolR